LTVYEVAFKIQRDSPTYQVSQRFPELTIATWCNKERDVIELSCDDDPEDLQELRESIPVLRRALAVKIMRKTVSGRSAQLVTEACSCRGEATSTPSLIERNNCLKIDPVFLRRGSAWYRILAFQQSDIKNLLDQLEKLAPLKIIYRSTLAAKPIKDTFVISASSMLGGLTKKQSIALLMALSRGYYDVPKKISTGEIAKGLGLPRTTFEEHLRKAESKALKAFMPLLQFAGSTKIPNLPRGEQQEAIPTIAP
jgi:predicted DNA binding protein